MFSSIFDIISNREIGLYILNKVGSYVLNIGIIFGNF